MAFNFNWSPLTADASFYERARDLLTTALNKSPKPPIIVDDIYCTELHLGSIPPELEILEIGDLAEDRFRGIFKMCYRGDAFLTLKTRVQANPLNTYLHSKPLFTSPRPLAASSGLTIPLSLTLSDIKLSAFIILVFSKQKGLTLVFRNDPLESLKVSSTFDTIPFVRDYLQKTIEGKLRDLIMDELPAIIHRLSLRLWCPDQLPREDIETKAEDDGTAVDPFASPPQDAVDANGNLLDIDGMSSLSLDGPDVQTMWSNKNLLRLAALSDCHRTLSLFTPGIEDVVFRACVGAQERNETQVNSTLPSPTLLRPSLHGASTTYTFSDTSSMSHGHLPSRPSLVSLGSATAGLSLGASRSRSHVGRKQKKRVVNLRRSKTTSAPASEASDSATETESVAAPFSEPIADSVIAEEPEVVIAPPTSSRLRLSETPPSQSQSPSSPRPPLAPLRVGDQLPSNRILSSLRRMEAASQAQSEKPQQQQDYQSEPASWRQQSEKACAGTAPVVLEPAWVMKMAGEIARRVVDEKQRRAGGSVWREQEDAPPPAYEAQ